ncbi:MAG: thioesterase [Saprospiraceae bacterium]
MVHSQHTEFFSIRAYAVDAKKQVHVPALIQLMHETAMQHVLDLKLSVWDLEPQNLAWVLTRLQVKIHQLPSLGQKIKIVTNPSGFEKIRTFRDYRVFTEDGQLLASAVSLWFLMNTQTRRLARVPAEIRQTIEGCIQTINEFLPKPDTKPPVFPNAQYQRTFRVGYHDLDFNEHLNNIHYVKWLLDTLPASFQKQHQLQQLDLFYKMECVLDDQIQGEVGSSGGNAFHHRLLKETQEVASAQSQWSVIL